MPRRPGIVSQRLQLHGRRGLASVRRDNRSYFQRSVASRPTQRGILRALIVLSRRDAIDPPSVNTLRFCHEGRRRCCFHKSVWIQTVLWAAASASPIKGQSLRCHGVEIKNLKCMIRLDLSVSRGAYAIRFI
ncbi:hypothetical protein EVAR_37803_1 [Eumeta japonica]|uniref:Uncharacterized protein n=1 Tax=Eumeta variegata TaxID=151549 RepID=A0A4C1W8Q8_EUMVA|nr:hypothetical protein EVAR_37803_1 [Eumeta japonica]